MQLRQWVLELPDFDDDPGWVSDHICWTGVDHTNLHDLLPMPYTVAAAKQTAANIRRVRDYLEIPIAVENPRSRNSNIIW